MTTIKLALDWTPNINHIGFFVANELGLYRQQGIILDVLNPRDDNYTLTPGKKLELDLADFAIAPFETVISLNNKNTIVQAIAVYAILQEDLSCIVSLSSSGIQSPKHLDATTYASYKARYEDHIVRQMVLNDGGEGTLNIVYPEKLGIWNTLLSGNANSTWIFDNWEGVEAANKNIELRKFYLSDYGIPYGYSPVVLAKKERITTNHTAYSAFIQATKKGFLYAKEHPADAVAMLQPHLTAHDAQNIDLSQSLNQTAKFFGDTTSCGTMKPERVKAFLHWLVDHNLETERILQQNLFTNELVW